MMIDFVDGKADVLLCTTIIESGLDIPRANTMFVNRADTFGLAQLYQLRGRIGRARERAFCYLHDSARGVARLRRQAAAGGAAALHRARRRAFRSRRTISRSAAPAICSAPSSRARSRRSASRPTRDARGGGGGAARASRSTRRPTPSSRAICRASSPTTTCPTSASASSSTGACRRRATKRRCARSSPRSPIATARRPTRSTSSPTS